VPGRQRDHLPHGRNPGWPSVRREDILYADLNRDDLTKAKLDFDVIGHYARPDVFNLTVNTAPRPSVQFQNQ